MSLVQTYNPFLYFIIKNIKFSSKVQMKKAIDVLQRMRRLQVEMNSGTVNTVVGLNEFGEEFVLPVHSDEKTWLPDGKSWVIMLSQSERHLEVDCFLDGVYEGHYHVVPEHIIMTDGELELKIGSTKEEMLAAESFTIHAGQVVTIPALSWHWAKSDGARYKVLWEV